MPAAYYAKAVTAYTAAHKLNAVLAIEVSSARPDVVLLSRVSRKNLPQLQAEVAPWLLFQQGQNTRA